MIILILPSSGGGFVNQLAMIQHLCESKIKPDTTLASSGGNVVAYIAAAANWKWAAVERISMDLSQELFISPWNNIIAIASLIGYFKGQIYNKGLGVEHFLKYYFDTDSIQDNEIWTGAYNKTNKKIRLFCNRAKNASILDTTNMTNNLNLTQCMEPCYMNGNLKSIADVGYASACIPGLIPPQIIDGEEYIDGCVGGSSPLTILQSSILEFSKKNKDPIHMIYVNSVNLEGNIISKPIKNVIDTLQQAAKDIIKTQAVIDRIAAYTILQAQPGKIMAKEFMCDYTNMEKLKSMYNTIGYSLLEIYPLHREELSLTKFNGDNIKFSIDKIYGNCACRFWWVI